MSCQRASVLCVAALSLSTLGCGEVSEEHGGERGELEVSLREDQQPLQRAAFPLELDEEHHLQAPLVVDNLTVWPVTAMEVRELGPFLTLHDAQALGVAQVSERSHGGAVGQIVVENHAEKPILILGGTVVTGGKQDRQIGQDVLILANSKQGVPAFCVENGRWQATREGRSTAGEFQSTGMLANKRVRASAQYEANQGRVWSNVSTINARSGKSPQTKTLLASLDDDDGGVHDRRDRIRAELAEFFDAFAGPDPLVGCAYAINGEPLSVRAFDDPELFQQHRDSFLRTMSLEAEAIQRRDERAGRAPYRQPAAAERVVELVQSVAAEEAQLAFESPSTLVRRKRSPKGGNAVCYLKGDEGEIRVSQDWTLAINVEKGGKSGLSPLLANVVYEIQSPLNGADSSGRYYLASTIPWTGIQADDSAEQLLQALGYTLGD